MITESRFRAFKCRVYFFSLFDENWRMLFPIMRICENLVLIKKVHWLICLNLHWYDRNGVNDLLVVSCENVKILLVVSEAVVWRCFVKKKTLAEPHF